MTLFHFGNCVALIYIPYYMVYKQSSLSEYDAFWKCVQSGFIYAITQLCKMIFLATFFPDIAATGIENFDIIGELLRSTVELIDVIGFYFALSRIAGRGHIKILTAAIGWASAEVLLTRCAMLWFGARRDEFDWKYIQKSLDCNINLVGNISISALVWMWSRSDIKKTCSKPLTILMLCFVYRSFIIEFLAYSIVATAWTAIALKVFITFGIATATLHLYSQYSSKT